MIKSAVEIAELPNDHIVRWQNVNFWSMVLFSPFICALEVIVYFGFFPVVCGECDEPVLSVANFSILFFIRALCFTYFGCFAIGLIPSVFCAVTINKFRSRLNNKLVRIISSPAIVVVAAGICLFCLALQLHIFLTSESMGDHDSEVMDDWIIDRSDA